MPPEHSSFFKAKMVAEILPYSQIFMNDSGYNFFNGIFDVMLKILAQVTDLAKEKNDLNYRMGSCGSMMVPSTFLFSWDLLIDDLVVKENSPV